MVMLLQRATYFKLLNIVSCLSPTVQMAYSNYLSKVEILFFYYSSYYCLIYTLTLHLLPSSIILKYIFWFHFFILLLLDRCINSLIVPFLTIT